MLALQSYEDACCSGCGGFLADTTDTAAEGSYRVEPTRCHRCTAIAREAVEYREYPHPQALLYRVGRR